MLMVTCEEDEMGSHGMSAELDASRMAHANYSDESLRVKAAYQGSKRQLCSIRRETKVLFDNNKDATDQTGEDFGNVHDEEKCRVAGSRQWTTAWRAASTLPETTCCTSAMSAWSGCYAAYGLRRPSTQRSWSPISPLSVDAVSRLLGHRVEVDLFHFGADAKPLKRLDTRCAQL
ncbi:uncharacterized protein LOC119103436 [Pollicipes pollicipes]|uniref:uncharacterized protein LOC119103436 n=1 Tax=Pollicipes pollicipes TaxID=41117 RepID=UPI0018849A2C|nr:uncharacterized protein LOC119103436 [Pollicipes pollicipes]